MKKSNKALKKALQNSPSRLLSPKEIVKQNIQTLRNGKIPSFKKWSTIKTPVIFSLLAYSLTEASASLPEIKQIYAENPERYYEAYQRYSDFFPTNTSWFKCDKKYAEYTFGILAALFETGSRLTVADRDTFTKLLFVEINPLTSSIVLGELSLFAFSESDGKMSPNVVQNYYMLAKDAYTPEHLSDSQVKTLCSSINMELPVKDEYIILEYFNTHYNKYVIDETDTTTHKSLALLKNNLNDHVLHDFPDITETVTSKVVKKEVILFALREYNRLYFVDAKLTSKETNFSKDELPHYSLNENQLTFATILIKTYFKFNNIPCPSTFC